jgi:hypothetical protein
MSTPVTVTPAASPRATVSLVCGIVGIMAGLGQCCCCLGTAVNLICAVTAWVLGHLELRDIDAGIAPAAGRSHASTGRILGMIGVGLVLLYLLALAGWIALAGFSTVVEALRSGPAWKH